MHLTTEIEDHHQRALIAGAADPQFIQLLKQRLTAHNVDVYRTSDVPEAVLSYDIVIFIDQPDILLPSLLEHPTKRFIFIFTKKSNLAQIYSSFVYEHKAEHIKVVQLDTRPQYYDKDIETLLWFAFARSADAYLHIYHEDLRSPPKRKPRTSWSSRLQKWLAEPRHLITLGIICLILAFFIFIPPLAAASIYNYRAAQAVRSGDTARVTQYQQQAATMLTVSSNFYTFSRPVFNFLSIARPIDSLFRLNTSGNIILTEYLTIKERSGRLLGQMMTPGAAGDVEDIVEDKTIIMSSLHSMHDELVIVKEIMPTWNEELKDTQTELETISTTLESLFEIEPHLDTLFALNDEKKYLLLFANNMELRPGGGFIGSFAIVRVRDYQLTELTVYDVYDADGQLTVQIPPPEPISEYLQQPYWYLRDSAFAADFPTNFTQAQEFLELELGESSFDGGILMTTTSVEYLLRSMDALHIADYDEQITAENFYLKTQIYAERDFFPGSQQKKRFLASVMDAMLLNLSEASPAELVRMLQRSLQEKQMVMYSRDAQLQQVIERNFWAGQLLTPQCQLETAVNCILDYIYPLDANLGVNKANYFISRPVALDVTVDESGVIQNTLTLAYENTSYENVFPGGTYRNYFQVYLPPNAQVLSVEVDGQKLTEFEETNFEFKTVGFLLEVPPQSSKGVVIQYQLPTTIIAGQGMYQLILQKQVGAPNNDFYLKVRVPDNIEIINNNFSPLVNTSEINYNTTISSDKIFVIEFAKR